MATESLWQFRIPLQQASHYVGTLDVVWGLMGILNIIFTRQQEDTPRIFGIYMDALLAAFLGGAFVTQVIMGLVLHYAAENKSRSLIRFWLFSTGLTALFTGLPIRICQMLIVYEFSAELRRNQKRGRTNGDVESTKVDMDKGITQKPQMHQNMEKNGKFEGDLFGNGHFQTQDQRLVAAPPLRSQYEVAGFQNQYLRQLLQYNSISQLHIPNPWILPALLAVSSQPQPNACAGIRRNSGSENELNHESNIVCDRY